MPNFVDRAGDYHGDAEGAFRAAGGYAWLMLAGWVLFPFAVQTVLHPGDAVLLMARLQGQRAVFRSGLPVGGEVFALIMLAALSVGQFFVTVMFFRRAGRVVPMWPVSGVLIGVIGNGAWWYATGAFDPAGALVGFAALALTVICEMLIERKANDLVFGADAPPGL